MTVHRRSLVLSAAIACLFPACISITSRPTPITPGDVAARITAEGAARATEVVRKPASEFAIYPSRPGEVVATKPIPKEATTAQKPAPLPVAPLPAGPITPPSPLMPVGGNPPIGSEPAVFPSIAIRKSPSEWPVLTALRAHSEGKPERAFEAIASLDKPNQELVLALLPVLARGASANIPADPLAAAMLIEQLRVAAARLEPFASLQIGAALFCEGTVNGFGRYAPWPLNKPYRPRDKAQLYLEVRNLMSQPAIGPHGETYATHARYRVEVRDAYGKRVLQPHPDDYQRRVEVAESEVNRFTRAPVQDFHFVHVFPVPATPGVYTVTVEVTDAAGRRAAKSAPVEFRVAGP